jgi:salicylate hydroxylase
MKTIIAGAGIGGLAASLALARAGFEAIAVERAARPTEVGAGLQLSPNAMKCLAALGVGEAIEAVSSEPEALELRIGKSGAKVFSIPMGAEARKRYGAPYLHIHRADLVDILTRAAAEAGVRIRYGARVLAFTRQDGEIRAGLDTGDILAADLLVGADGMRSTIRRQMLGEDRPRFTGSAAWRLTVPASAAPDLAPVATVWAGPKRHAVTYRIRRGEMINFVGVVETDRWRSESWDEAGDLAELVRDFEGWAEPIPSIIAAAKTCHLWALFDRNPLPRWSDGPVTLLGDACHPMPPFQAQGAAMAIEDAMVLARCLSQPGEEVETALQRYEHLRKPRTTKVLMSARSNMGVFHRSNLLTRTATYGPMRIASAVMPAFVNSRQDWIYGFDATQG